MSKTRNLLQKNKKYFFCVLYGIDIDTISKLNYKLFGLQAIEIFSQEFDRLTKQIPGFPDILKEEFELFKYYHAHDISMLFISEKEENLYNFYDILRLLRPSKISIWLTFDTYYINYKSAGTKIEEHHANGYSHWASIHELYDTLEVEDIFYLINDDIIFVNKLVSKYETFCNTPSFLKFMSLYRRAYHEEKDYFKFLLFFMTIESLIKDDEITGVVYKIRRLCAVLIGNTIKDCEMIFDKTRDAYNIRSKLVHSAKDEISDAKYLPYVHSIVCELGIMILICKIETDQIFKISNKLGFSERKSLILTRTLRSYTNMQKNRLNFHLLDKKKKK